MSTGVPDRDALEQVDHVGHVHADAAVRRARADRVVLAGAVDADAVGDAHPARLQRVGGAAALDGGALQLAGPRASWAPTTPG